MAEKYLLVIGK